jgi:hypothetical protein
MPRVFEELRRYGPQTPAVQTFGGKHWSLSVQVVWQPPGVQAKGAQSTAAAPGVQAPPLQVEAAVKNDPAQEAAAHTPTCVPQPLAVQTPVVPQVDAAVAGQLSRSASAPVTPWQVPSAFPHDWQTPQLGVVQHRPSTQLLLRHSDPARQVAPGALRAVQLPPGPVQFGVADAQSLAELQVTRHAVGPQAKGAHIWVGCVHPPAPLQVPIRVAVPPEHEGVPQEPLPRAACAQAPLPLHIPVFPQGGLGEHCPAGAMVPAPRLVQAPSFPETLQALQVPQLMALQQTPSTQKLLVRHSVVALHAAPSGLRFPQTVVVGSQMLGARHSAFEAQAVLHPLPSARQTKGSHELLEPAAQFPAPSQVPASVRVEPVQEGARHWVPAANLRQAPAPSQKPSFPQLAAPAFWQVAVGSVAPFATGVQVPAEPARAHERQTPVQAVLQQTPWAQMVDPHSAPSAQVAPSGFSPQEPALQTAGDAQSASAVQVFLQTAVPQVKGKHDDDAGVTQAPAPSQADPGVKVVLPAGQVESRQGVPCGYRWQAPAWHLPLVPQLAAPWSVQVLAGSGLPVGTLVQVPSVPAREHDLQALAQAVLQQIPWAQFPDWHSVAVAHTAPFAFLPQLFTLQTFGGRQLSVRVQAVKHLVPLHL